MKLIRSIESSLMDAKTINPRQMSTVRTNHRPEEATDQLLLSANYLPWTSILGSFHFLVFLARKEEGNPACMQVWNVRMKEKKGRRPRCLTRELERGDLLLESEDTWKSRWRTRWRIWGGKSMTLESRFESFETTRDSVKDVLSSCR